MRERVESLKIRSGSNLKKQIEVELGEAPQKQH